MAQMDEKEILKSLNFLGNPTTVLQGGAANPTLGAGPAPGIAASGTGPTGLATGAPGQGAGAAAGGGTNQSGGGSGSGFMDALMRALGLAEKGTGLAKSLMPGDLGTRGDVGGSSLSDILRSGGGAGTALSDGGSELDAIRGLFGGVGGVPGSTPDSLGAFGGLGGSLSDVLRSGGNAGNPAETLFSAPGATSATGAAGTGVPGTADAVSGAGGDLASGIGAGGAGAGVISALLDWIGSATGNKDLSKAGEALGAAGSAASLAGTGASLASTGGALGASAGAGAAFAPVAAGLLATSIANMISPGSAPSIADPLNEDPAIAGYFPMFGKKLAGTLGAENTDLNTLASTLPYAGSQQELSALLDRFKSDMGGHIGGFGQGSDPFTVPNVPGAGGSAHEGGQTADFGSEVNTLNDIIGQLKGGLPETGGGDAGQLWNQQMTQVTNGAPSIAPGGANAPFTVQMPDGSTKIMDPYAYYNYYNNLALDPAVAAGQTQLPQYMSGVTQYGQPGYDYAAAGLTPPGQAPGATSSAWEALLAGGGGGAGGAAPAGAAPTMSADQMSGILAKLQAGGGGTEAAFAGPGGMDIATLERLRAMGLVA